MKRRDFVKASMAVAALAAHGDRVAAAEAAPEEDDTFPKAPGLTKYVSEFIVNTKYEDIPDEVRALGRKSILDGFGLALAGSVSEMGPLVRKYVATFGPATEQVSIIGTGMKAHPRFAAFANGVSIHADDFDDTQLSAAKDRVYGLLTHPTVPVLPPAFALCELKGRTGKDLTLAYHVGVEVVGIVRKRRRVCQAPRAGRHANRARAGYRRSRGEWVEGEFRVNDQTLPCRACRGKWHGGRGPGLPRLDGGRRYSRGAARVLPRGRRRF
jgi:hypothetical protein